MKYNILVYISIIIIILSCLINLKTNNIEKAYIVIFINKKTVIDIVPIVKKQIVNITQIKKDIIIKPIINKKTTKKDIILYEIYKIEDDSNQILICD